MRVGGLVWLAVLAFARAAAPAGDAPEFAGEIVIGATFPLSGDLESYGQSAYYGANARVRLVNAEGGVRGKRLVLEWRDNRSDPQQAARDIEDLVTSRGVAAVLGPLDTEALVAADPVIRRLGVVSVSPLTSAESAGRDNPWIFRTGFTNTAISNGVARFQIEGYGARTCSILYDPRYIFTRELADEFAEVFARRGGRVLAKVPFGGADGAFDYATPLKALAAENPDFIFVPSYAAQAAELIHAARDLGIGVPFSGPHTWDVEILFDSAGSRLAGSSFASALFEQEFKYKPFQTFFNAMEEAGMDNPDALAACAYDAVSLLALALQTGERPEDIRRGFQRMRRVALATGRTTITADRGAEKTVIIRIVERRDGHLVPVYAARYDP